MGIKLTGKRCKCQTCHRVFSSEYGFNQHRIMVNGERVCAVPEMVKLELKPSGVYGGVGSFDRGDAA